MPIPVVNYARLERLKPPENKNIQWNLNTFLIIIICISVLCMYKRASNIHTRRRRYITLDGYLEQIDHSSPDTMP
jgi:hypothetical protein